ncbi:hypothetical protein [Nocardia sp. N2S4-5]|uniref:hypothetical protein n=1 Tax=Nocardia sp. N2S4-5 TaxID=3351565 RepID=UPI0037CF264B
MRQPLRGLETLPDLFQASDHLGALVATGAGRQHRLAAVDHRIHLVERVDLVPTATGQRLEPLPQTVSLRRLVEDLLDPIELRPIAFEPGKQTLTKRLDRLIGCSRLVQAIEKRLAPAQHQELGVLRCADEHLAHTGFRLRELPVLGHIGQPVGVHRQIAVLGPGDLLHRRDRLQDQ